MKSPSYGNKSQRSTKPNSDRPDLDEDDKDFPMSDFEASYKDDHG